MKNLFLVISILSISLANAQTDSVKAIQAINSFQKELNAEYRDRKKSPLEPEDFKKFEGHSFFPIDLKYRVSAKLNRNVNSAFFPMKTYGSRLPNYRVYAVAEFKLEGKTFTLPIYQSQDLMAKPEYADYLFFPFTDLTNGHGTYDAGRYIDLRIPEGDELIIDFNQAYNPYCAYGHGYSCPVVPSENNLNIEVLAGVKYSKK